MLEFKQIHDRIIEVFDKYGLFVTLRKIKNFGWVVMEIGRDGFYEATELRQIADKLDELNNQKKQSTLTKK